MGYSEEDFRDLSTLAYEECEKTAKRCLCGVQADREKIDALTNALVPSFLEHVILAEVKQSKVQKLFQKLKQLRDDDKIYEIGIDKAQFDSGFEVIQDHTQKAIIILSLLLGELNVADSSRLSARKSAATNMDEFIKSVKFALS